MDISPINVQYYQTGSGRCPFKDWLDSLGSTEQVAVDSRLTRIRRGLFGDHEYLGSGVYEFKFHVGPGYRIYYGKEGKTLVILLQGGDKKSQPADIETAHGYWLDYLRRSKK
ncbi:MAG: type II toxin-antitoxin system RelE/ParE family toxin [Elusimicrobiota bacterium]|nr:type II toxin-antitoxin system RelE/ParE family toxin [Elusimicrobiota bacterium]